FHDWRWGGDGRCKLVPYAKRTPRLARTAAWPTLEQDGMLFVWNDPERKAPPEDVTIPRIEGADSDGWTDWHWYTTVVNTNCREIIDNVTDMAHFFYIHFGLPTYFKNVFEGHIASQYLHNVGRQDIGGMGTQYGESHLDSEASYFGPSFMINWLHNNYSGYKAESILINCHYPVSQDAFMLQWGVIVEKPKGMDEKTTQKLADAMTDGVSKGFMQDVEIWKHKTRIDNPLLVEEDGAVYQMRRWYQQFYVDVADITPDMTDRFEMEIDTTAANEKWTVEVQENLRSQESKAAEKSAQTESLQSN
nr:3-ketosteroid-9-alpha-hydroxylase [Streptomyces sp. DSM 41633]